MKYMKITGIVLILAFALSACGGAATPTSVPVNTLPATTDTVEPLSSATPEVTGTETPAVSTTGTVAVPVTGADCTTVTVQTASAASAATTSGGGTSATSMPSATGTGTPATTTTGTGTPSVTTGATSTVKTGDFLVDCNGMTLYINTDDTANSGTSTCTTDCATEWPPLTVKDGETPMAGEGVDASLLSTLTRDDGTLQVTYNGWPLHLFSGDSLPGDTNGAGDQGKWFLISPAGEPIQQ